MSDKQKSIELYNVESRRKALMVALFGAGVPVSQKLIPATWTSPVVNSVLLTAHAETSNPDSGPIGVFGPSEETSDNSSTSVFDNIAERTEAEILDLFVNAAEAADTCPTNSSCDSTGTVEVDVAATITQNPSAVECLQARVTISNDSSCASHCLLFNFDAEVNGSSVSVSQDCDLKLVSIELVDGGLTGNWNYVSDSMNKAGQFESVSGTGGCGSLGCVE